MADPSFEMTDTSITALVGQTVYLPCRVNNLGDKVVSWIRTHDLHILTSGDLTYTSDARFEVLHPPGSDSWTLRIMSVQTRDEGKYECQVNTDPKMNLAVVLTLREYDMGDSPYDESESHFTSASQTGAPPLAMAVIMGRQEQYVHLGSTITFTCLVTAPYTHARLPRSVDWFHGKRLVSVQAARGGISLDTEKTDLQTTSRLTVAGVTEKDAGNYTCSPSDTRPAIVTLVVVQAVKLNTTGALANYATEAGERTEAMQRDGNNSGASKPTPRGHHVCRQYEHMTLTLACTSLYWWWWNSHHVLDVT
uniref:Ig-like domain-containing protein n=1 Tax=Timema shepardi TaxID=629360 RepID=A0A7R9ATU3_TIMSH|nr:unnamed protein product [Timema shepardi]